jgi:hypothetical protein
MTPTIRTEVIELLAIGALAFVGVVWLVARVLKTCSDELDTDFQELKSKERL